MKGNKFWDVVKGPRNEDIEKEVNEAMMNKRRWYAKNFKSVLVHMGNPPKISIKVHINNNKKESINNNDDNIC